MEVTSYLNRAANLPFLATIATDILKKIPDSATEQSDGAGR